MRVAILGSSGLLGSALQVELAGWPEWDVVTVSRRPTTLTSKHHQLSSLQEVIELVGTKRFDVVINCVALASHELCEEKEEHAFILNAVFPEELATVCARTGTRLVHISTDAVFDGPHLEPFTELDTPEPRSAYGRSKFEGERRVLAQNTSAMVVRTNFFAWSRSGQSGVLDFFVNGLSAGREIPGFTDYITSSTYVADLASSLKDLVELDYAGVIHAVSSQAISKFAFGQVVAEVFRLPPSLVVESSLLSQQGLAHRAPNLALSPRRLEALLDRKAPTVREGIQKAKVERGSFESFWGAR